MRFAYLKDGTTEIKVHINDYTDDMKGKIFCPDGHEMVAKRGDVKAHHYCHGKGVDCDCGGGGMTSWHINFQNRAILEVQEVRCKVDGKLHIADTLCNGHVIEYQHSPMDAPTMRKREKFYTGLGHKLIWVFDCSHEGANWNIKTMKKGGKYITIRKQSGNDFPMLGSYTGNVQKIYDFGRKQLLLVTEEKGKNITGQFITLREFDQLYLGSSVSKNNDYRVFHHDL